MLIEAPPHERLVFHFIDVAEIWLVTLYAKGEVEDLSPDDKRRLKWLVDLEISRRRKRARDRGDRR